LSTTVILKINIKIELFFVVYLGAQCIYNYNHFKEIKEDSLSNPARVSHLKGHLTYIPIMTATYGIIYFSLLVYFGNKLTIFFGGFLLLLGLLFTIKGKKISKKIIGFKSFYASLAWALLVFFIAIYHSYPINITVFVLFIFIFIRLVVNTSFSDIKDLRSDKKEKILTLAMLPKNHFLNLLHILNFISFIPLFFGLILGIMPRCSLLLLPTFFYSYYYIQKAKNKEISKNSLYGIIVDGEYYYWPLMLLLGILILGY
ncbi:MAG: UbiA family prenyltransferase, partial [Candidatus Thermoplasmatota archaeon]|nr:UbiA family prenyltransferase [Candidatus Thermoplasmatota archaeon]